MLADVQTPFLGTPWIYKDELLCPGRGYKDVMVKPPVVWKPKKALQGRGTKIPLEVKYGLWRGWRLAAWCGAAWRGVVLYVQFGAWLQHITNHDEHDSAWRWVYFSYPTIICVCFKSPTASGKTALDRWKNGVHPAGRRVRRRYFLISGANSYYYYIRFPITIIIVLLKYDHYIIITVWLYISYTILWSWYVTTMIMVTARRSDGFSIIL